MKKYSISNIKSFSNSGEIEIAPITLFVGPNSCGKSSLIRFPAVLAQSVQNGQLVLNGDNVDYGFIKDIIHNNSGNTVSYSVTFDIKDIDAIAFTKADALENINSITYEVDLFIENDIAKTKNAKIYLNKDVAVEFVENNEKYIINLFKSISNNSIEKCNHTIELGYPSRYRFGIPRYRRKDIQEHFFDINNLDYDEKYFKFFTILEFFYNQGETNQIHQMAEKLGVDIDIPEDDLKIICDYTNMFELINDLINSANKYFLSLHYIGPFRVAPSRLYRLYEKNGFNVGPNGENAIGILLRENNLEINKLITKWIRRTMGYSLFTQDLHNGYSQVMLRNEKGVETNIPDVGFGLSQIAPILIQTIFSSRKEKTPNLILVEQPELHLHPAAQAQLADFFAESVLEAKGNVSVILETHSEHLIKKLQVLISNPSSPLTSDMVKIYYVNKIDDESSVKEMKLTPNGQFENEWPTGFFDQAYKLSLELLKNI